MLKRQLSNLKSSRVTRACATVLLVLLATLSARAACSSAFIVETDNPNNYIFCRLTKQNAYGCVYACTEEQLKPNLS